VWHFDPVGEVDEKLEGVEAAHWSPLASIQTWDDALAVGRSMGNAMVSRGSEGEDHWVARAIQWVQTLLYAGHLARESIGTVVDWAMASSEKKESDAPLGILSEHLETDPGAYIAYRMLDGLVQLPSRERASIVSVMARMLSVYSSPGARAVGDVTIGPAFSPYDFVRSQDTLYITAAPDKQDLYAPLLAALLEQIRLKTYELNKRMLARKERMPNHVTFALDEANTTAPIPLPAIISEAGGQGLHVVVGIQALGSSIARWGEAARSFLTLFPTKVVLRGIFDHETLTALSEASGEYEKTMVSYSFPEARANSAFRTHFSNVSYQTQQRRQLNPGDITGIPADQALVWSGPNCQLVEIDKRWRSEECSVWGKIMHEVKYPVHHQRQIAARPDMFPTGYA